MRISLLAAGLVTLLGLSSARADPAADKKTERSFKANCSSCHGVDGKGQTEQGKKMGIGDMSSAPWQAKFTNEQMKQTISDGFKRTKDGKAQEMEAFKTKLKPEQIDALVTYVRSLAK